MQNANCDKYLSNAICMKGPWVSKNEKEEIILAGVHKAGACQSDEVPHVAVQVSHAPFLKWIKDVTGINT